MYLVHASTVSALAAYAARRDQLCLRPRTARSSSPRPVLGWPPPRCRRRSGSCCARPGSGNTPGVGHAFMTSATPWRCARCWTGTRRRGRAGAAAVAVHLSRPHGPASTYWYLSAAPELMAMAADRLERHPGRRHDRARPDPAGVLHRAAARPSGRASPHTVAAYRDTFRLLLRFAAQQTGKPPSQLEIDDLDAALVGAFLDHLETERGTTACAPATPGWPRSTRCSATPRYRKLPITRPICSRRLSAVDGS